MWNPFKDKEFKKEWDIAFKSVFRPQVLIFLGMAILFMGISYESENSKIRIFLELFLVIISGIATASIVSYWDKKTKDAKVKLKGSSAIRNLANIDEKLKNIIGRIKTFSSERENKKMKRDLGEIRNLAVMLLLDVQNAKDDWGDIIDSRELRELEKYERQLDKVVQEKKNLMTENNENKEEIEKKDEEIEKIQKDFNDYKYKNNLDMIGGATISTLGYTPNNADIAVNGLNIASTYSICSNCGKLDYNLNKEKLCSECANKNLFLTSKP